MTDAAFQAAVQSLMQGGMLFGEAVRVARAHRGRHAAQIDEAERKHRRELVLQAIERKRVARVARGERLRQHYLEKYA